jgi:HSP20 family protein
MPDLKRWRDRLQGTVGQAWGALTEGWRELLSRSSGALTHFDTSRKATGRREPRQDFPHWSLLAAETWETAQSLFVRIEVPGVRREDLDISITAHAVVVRGVKRSEGAQQGRLYNLMERAYGRFERSVPIPHEVDGERAEVSYKDGVITVIVPKIEATPPRRLKIP